MTTFADYVIFLTAAHFVGDWFLQTDFIQQNKARNSRLRWLHVFLATLPTGVGLLFLSADPKMLSAVYLWLVGSHWLIDSYLPLYWWRKVVMRDPECESIERFAAAFNTPRGMVVYVAMDQMLHFFCLIPAAVWLWRK